MTDDLRESADRRDEKLELLKIILHEIEMQCRHMPAVLKEVYEMNCPLNHGFCGNCHWFQMEGDCTYPNQDNAPDRVALKCQKCGHEFWVSGASITTSAGECPKCRSYRTLYDDKRDKAVTE